LIYIPLREIEVKCLSDIPLEKLSYPPLYSLIYAMNISEILDELWQKVFIWEIWRLKVYWDENKYISEKTITQKDISEKKNDFFSVTNKWDVS
jgi:hypothetical protein